MYIQTNVCAQQNILDQLVKHVRKSPEYTFAMVDRMTLCCFNIISLCKIKQSVFLTVIMGHVQALRSAHVIQDILVLVVGFFSGACYTQTVLDQAWTGLRTVYYGQGYNYSCGWLNLRRCRGTR